MKPGKSITLGAATVPTFLVMAQQAVTTFLVMAHKAGTTPAPAQASAGICLVPGKPVARSGSTDGPVLDASGGVTPHGAPSSSVATTWSRCADPPSAPGLVAQRGCSR